MSWIRSIFGICFHRRMTFPQTVGKECSVVCLDCTARFAYDPKAWKRGGKK